MSLSPEELCNHLATLSPALSELFNEHRTDNFGEILPYVFLADVARFVASNRPGTSLAIDYLNSSLKNVSKDIDNLIAVGFIESLDDFKVIQNISSYQIHCHLKEEWERQHNT